MNLIIQIHIEDVENVDTESVRAYFDKAVEDLPRDAVENIGGGWNVRVQETG